MTWPVWRAWVDAQAVANGRAQVTGRRQSVRRFGTGWCVREADR